MSTLLIFFSNSLNTYFNPQVFLGFNEQLLLLYSSIQNRLSLLFFLLFSTRCFIDKAIVVWAEFLSDHHFSANCP